jgi:hypothetical protein
VELRFLYVGSADTEGDLGSWLGVPGARRPWRFGDFGADVAAVDLGVGPLVLVADHRPAGTVLPIYAVDDVDDVAACMVAAGWTRHDGPVGTPEGPAVVLEDSSGTLVALLRVDRPDAMDQAYADTTNVNARRRP